MRIQDGLKDIGNLEETEFASNLVLSPRTQVGKLSSHGNAKYGLSCCVRCKNAVYNGRRPFFAIINKNYVGCAPDCLKELNEVKLALLTPVKHHGYCFHYKGGAQWILKRTLTFMRVEKCSIAKAIATVEAMGFTKHLLVLYTGALTKNQKKRTIEKTRICTEKVIIALDWLHANHHQWKLVDLNVICSWLTSSIPTIVDHSEEVESQNSNIEEEEAFTVYYPDGVTNPKQGGFDEPGAFKKYVEEMQKKGFDIEFQMI